MKAICKGCYYNKGTWCNRLVVVGGFGMKDRTAIMYASDDKCDYRKEGKSLRDENKPNFENS